MKSKLKKPILKMLSENLESFFPEYKGMFMCPTCLDVIPINNLGAISEAHIIPKAAGGKLKTFLCTKCNSTFGANQDKWFGELIRISNDPEASIFSTTIKDGYFEIDGMRVNGHWRDNKDEGFEFIVHYDRNSPETNQKFQNKFRMNNPKMELTVPIPLLRNEEMIGPGFLTAAYLMWFGYLGYSWVLQKHLDPIRSQIRNPLKKTIEPKYLLSADPAKWDPWIGLIELAGDTLPAFGLKNRLVIFPPRYKPLYYEQIDGTSFNLNFQDIIRFGALDKPFYGPPICYLREKRVVIGAMRFKEALSQGCVILFPEGENEGVPLWPVDSDSYEKMIREHKDVRKIKVKAPYDII